jgi:hypothetical protein
MLQENRLSAAVGMSADPAQCLSRFRLATSVARLLFFPYSACGRSFILLCGRSCFGSSATKVELYKDSGRAILVQHVLNLRNSPSMDGQFAFIGHAGSRSWTLGARSRRPGGRHALHAPPSCRSQGSGACDALPPRGRFVPGTRLCRTFISIPRLLLSES